MNKIQWFIRKYWPFLFVSFILLMFIEWAVGAGLVPKFIIPKPTDVLLAIEDQWPQLINHTQATLIEVLVGTTISIVFGLLIGILLYYSDFMERAFYPFILISQTIPTIALSPIFVLWFGYSIWTKVAIIFLITFFPVVVSVYDGLKRTDSEYLELFRVMGATPFQMFSQLQWKFALPSIYSGLKMSVVYSLIGAVIGEWLGGSEGLGYYIRRMSSSIKSDGVFAGIIVLSLIGIILFNLVGLFESQSLKYLHTERRK